MIVSHEHKLIFLKPRKVAGTSFEIALSKYLTARDIITPISPADEDTRRDLGFRTAQNFKLGVREMLYGAGPRRILRLARRRKGQLKFHDLMPAKKFYNHISAKKCRKRLGADFWDAYLKVSIVRNPWDVIVSSYYYANRHDDPPQEFAAWCHQRRKMVGRNARQYAIDGKQVIDIFVRFENFEEDIGVLEQRCPGLSGLYDTFASIRAKAGLRPVYSRDLSPFFVDQPELNRLIENKCQFEIQKFGYALT